MSLHGVFTRCLYTVSAHASCSEFLVLRTCQIDQLSSCLTDCLLFSWGFSSETHPFLGRFCWPGRLLLLFWSAGYSLHLTDFFKRVSPMNSCSLIVEYLPAESSPEMAGNSPCHLCPKWLDITMPLGSLSYVIGSLVLFQLRFDSIGDHDRVIVSWMSSIHESNVRLAYSLSLLVLCVTRQRIAMHVCTE